MAKRKPNRHPRSTSLSPLRPKPKRLCSAEPSQSSFRKLSETATRQSLFDEFQPFDYDDNGPLDALRYVNLESDLAGRFRDKRIEVNTWAVPQFVWILSNNENAKMEDRWNIRSADDAVPSEYKKKWMEVEDKTKADEINLILSMLRKGSRTMAAQLDSSTWSWTWRPLNKEERTLSQSGQGPLNKEERTLSQSGQGDGKKGGKAKEVAKNKKKSSDEDKEEVYYPVYLLYAGTLRNLSAELARSMVSGFIHKMTDGKGQRFLKNCLDVATLIIGGPAQLLNNSFAVMETEGFRVGKVQMESIDVPKESPVPCGSPELIDIPKVPVACGSPEFRLPGLPKEIPGTPVIHRSSIVSSHDSICDGIDVTDDATSVACRNVANKGFIFPDCCVVSRDKSNFARYLLIAEIKSTNDFLPIRDRAQLYREMLGGGIHQTEVFGIMINYVQAYIIRMQMDKENKVITFSEKMYDFTPPKGSSFNYKAFDEFFRSMIAVLHYADDNISELKMYE